MTTAASAGIEHLLRELAPQVLGALARRFGDFAAAEDAMQEALLAAATQWRDGDLPDSPRAWLIHVATRRMTDHLRSSIARREREAEVVRSQWPFSAAGTTGEAAIDADVDTGADAADDSLPLLFMCCHPALTRASAIALTLRAVAGLTTAQIAGAFLVPEATMAQRISRAKQSVRDSGIAFERPDAQAQHERLDSVLHVIYLIFNEGYTSSGSDTLHRVELSDEAIRLARIVHTALPQHGEAAGLLALMLLTDARRLARTRDDGTLVPLAEQDRSRWNRAAIDEGIALVSATLSRGAAGAYAIQAAIAAVHAEAAHADDTDWAQILALYDVLAALADNPIVELNRAVALAMVHGPAAGLARVDALASDPRIANNHRVDAVRAHLLERAGEHEAAIAAFVRAAERTTSLAERDYLSLQAARLREATSD